MAWSHCDWVAPCEQAAGGQKGPEVAAVPVVPDGVRGEGRARGRAADRLPRAAVACARAHEARPWVPADEGSRVASRCLRGPCPELRMMQLPEVASARPGWCRPAPRRPQVRRDGPRFLEIKRVHDHLSCFFKEKRCLTQPLRSNTGFQHKKTDGKFKVLELL